LRRHHRLYAGEVFADAILLRNYPTTLSFDKPDAGSADPV
jgi:hypothetical protein